MVRKSSTKLELSMKKRRIGILAFRTRAELTLPFDDPHSQETIVRLASPVLQHMYPLHGTTSQPFFEARVHALPSPRMREAHAIRRRTAQAPKPKSSTRQSDFPTADKDRPHACLSDGRIPRSRCFPWWWRALVAGLGRRRRSAIR